MRKLFLPICISSVLFACLGACKVTVGEKPSSKEPQSLAPATLANWDGRSDRTDASWALQSLR